MATYDADLGMICRMRARYAPAAEAGIGMQVFRMMELLAPGSSLAPGVRDIVAGRLRTELS
jgi:hypothetical protein